MYYSLIPLFPTREGDPFVFWDNFNHSVIIHHGEHFFLIHYSFLDPRQGPFTTKVNVVKLRDGRGRTVATYDRHFDRLTIKRDGKDLEFSAPCRPVSYCECNGEKTYALKKAIEECNARYRLLLSC